MSHKISRRQFFKTGAMSAGMIAGMTSTKPVRARPPGPDENLVRDLTPGSTPIRLGRRFFPRADENLAESVKKLRDLGITGFRLGINELNLIKESRLDEFMTAIKKYDVRVLEVGCFTNFIHPVRTTRQNYLKELATCIEASDMVECPTIGTIAGCCDPEYAYNVHPDNWSEKTGKILVQSVKQVLQDTAGMKAAIGMEAQVTTTIDGPEAHRRLIDDVGDPRCAVELDPINMISLNNYYHTTELINKCFDLLGESILSCHSKDTYIWPDKQTVHVQEVCTGRGVLDHETYLVRMSRLKWPRMLRPEHIPADQYPEADAYIKKVAAKVGVKIYGLDY